VPLSSLLRTRANTLRGKRCWSMGASARALLWRFQRSPHNNLEAVPEFNLDLSLKKCHASRSIPLNWNMKAMASADGNFWIRVADTYGEMSQMAADIVLEDLKKNPRLLFCASAGGTPTGLYQALAMRHTRQPRLFSQMRVLQIDEWGGLPAGHPASCEADVRTKLLLPLEIPANRFTCFRSDAPDPVKECARISDWLKASGPIDICILGLGLNGHIAMNEPADALKPFVHVAKLSKRSQQHGMLTDLKSKPKFGFTLGMADILSSQKILLLVSGAHKCEMLENLLGSKVSTQLPASFLALHPNTIVVCDREAVGKTKRRSKRK